MQAFTFIPNFQQKNGSIPKNVFPASVIILSLHRNTISRMTSAPTWRLSADRISCLDRNNSCRNTADDRLLQFDHCSRSPGGQLLRTGPRDDGGFPGAGIGGWICSGKQSFRKRDFYRKRAVFPAGTGSARHNRRPWNGAAESVNYKSRFYTGEFPLRRRKLSFFALFLKMEGECPR